MPPRQKSHDNPATRASFAARQHGCISRGQMVALGITERIIDRLLRDGLYTRPYAGVYAVAGTPPTFEHKITAAILGAGGRAAASHSSAVKLLELRPCSLTVEISVPRNQRPALGDTVRVHRPSVLLHEHVTTVGVIPVTTVARTICDLAGGGHDPRGVELTLDHALARRLVTLDQIRAVLDAFGPPWPGHPLMRALLGARPEGAARAESPLELDLHHILERAGITGWAPNAWIETPGGPYRVDVLFEAEHLIVESNSFLHHSVLTDWSKDQRRMTDIAVAGYRILTTTIEDLRDEPRLVEAIRRARESALVGAAP